MNRINSVGKPLATELFARDSGQPQKHNPVSHGEQYQSKYRAFRDDKADVLNYIVLLSQ